MTQAPPSYRSGSWWDRLVMREADREHMGMGERIGNIIGMFFIVFVALLFLNIQIQNYGFFTSGFGPLEQVLFYGSLLYGIVPSLVKAITARRNLGRFFDLMGSAIFIVVAIYLLATFPFDFTQLLDFVNVHLSSSWFNNELFMALFTIGIIIGAISMIYNAVLYVSVRRELKDRQAARAASTGPSVQP